jgi:hypothetical protein
MESTSEDNSDKTKHIIELIETLFDNGDEKDKERLIRKINKLSDEDKTFINDKAKTLIDIDNNMITTINSEKLILSLNKLQMNILTLFLMSRIPECSNDINLILKNFNEKIANVNKIIKYNLDDKNNTSDSANYSTEEPQTPKGSPTEQKKVQPSTEQENENDKNVSLIKLKEQETKNINEELQKKEKEKEALEELNKQLKERVELDKKKLDEELQKLKNENTQLKEKTATCNRPKPKEQKKIPNTEYKINSLDDLYKYIHDFNKDTDINNQSMNTQNIQDLTKNSFLSGIDNLEYKQIVEEILNKKYTYKRLFSLVEKIKKKYRD